MNKGPSAQTFLRNKGPSAQRNTIHEAQIKIFYMKNVKEDEQWKIIVITVMNIYGVVVNAGTWTKNNLVGGRIMTA